MPNILILRAVMSALNSWPCPALLHDLGTTISPDLLDPARPVRGLPSKTVPLLPEPLKRPDIRDHL